MIPGMTPAELTARTTQFAYQIVYFTRPLLQDAERRDIARQLRRAGTSVGANYRAVGRARSRREFISKIGVVIEEVDEAEFWLELIRNCDGIVDVELTRLINEAGELVRILVRSRQTARERLKAQSSPNRIGEC